MAPAIRDCLWADRVPSPFAPTQGSEDVDLSRRQMITETTETVVGLDPQGLVLGRADDPLV